MGTQTWASEQEMEESKSFWTPGPMLPSVSPSDPQLHRSVLLVHIFHIPAHRPLTRREILKRTEIFKSVETHGVK